jgi:hypothetical protein
MPRETSVSEAFTPGAQLIDEVSPEGCASRSAGVVKARPRTQQRFLGPLTTRLHALRVGRAQAEQPQSVIADAIRNCAFATLQLQSIRHGGKDLCQRWRRY